LKILVTGASGLIGNAIVEKLAGSFEVFCLYRNLSLNQTSQNVTYIYFDLINKESIAKIKDIKPEIIIHCAALVPSQSSPNDESLYRTNTLIDSNIITAAKELNSYLVYMSSTIVYGYKDNNYNITEGQLVTKNSPYAKQKIESEILICQKINKYIILRISAPYGYNMKSKTVLTIFIDKALKGETLKFHGSGSRMQDFTNTYDIAQFIYEIIKENKLFNGVYNISAGKPICMKDLAQLVVKTTRSKSKIEPSGQPDEQENYKASYSIEKAKNILGWNSKIILEKGILNLVQSINN